MSATPWSMDHRLRVTAKIMKESARAAARLGATSVVIVAFWKDGEHYHIQDAGNAPMPLPDLYKHLLTAHHAVQELPPGKDGVSLS